LVGVEFGVEALKDGAHRGGEGGAGAEVVEWLCDGQACGLEDLRQFALEALQGGELVPLCGEGFPNSVFECAMRGRGKRS